MMRLLPLLLGCGISTLVTVYNQDIGNTICERRRLYVLVGKRSRAFAG